MRRAPALGARLLAALLTVGTLTVGCAPAAETPGAAAGTAAGADGAESMEENRAGSAAAAEEASRPGTRPVAPRIPAEIPAGGFRGIDVSHHSGEVDWQEVLADGVHFVYLKATEGNDAGDPTFSEHWRTLGELRAPRGAYHFYVTEDAPETQARFFLDTLREAGVGAGDLLPVVDVELLGHGTEPGWPERLARFVELVEDELGVAPAIYTAPDFWSSEVAAELGDALAGQPLWVAEYGVGSPAVPKGWDDWTLWQWRGDAQVPGVEKEADLSRLHPDLHLSELQIIQIIAGPPPESQERTP